MTPVAEAPAGRLAVTSSQNRPPLAVRSTSGLRDGPRAASLTPRPANLTEPHVGWHTHGDIYWWLTHGFPRSAMPGFAQQTSELERWQLIDHLTALSLGHQARNLGPRPLPREPWLAAIDFRYRLADGSWTSLADWRRRSPLLLVLLHDERELPRLAELSTLGGREPLRVIVVVPSTLASRLPPAARFDVAVDEDGSVFTAWSNYRRTLAAPDFRDEEPRVPRLEFLVDRFGFVRARWRSDEAPFAAGGDALRAALTQLAGEPELKSPDVHAH